MLLVLVLCLAATCGAHAKRPPKPLFASDAPLGVTLQAPWPELRKKSSPARRHPAVLSYTDAQGRVHRIEATVERRGITRLEVCRFPPLRLRFARGAVAGTEFERQKSLKLVTHCNAGPPWEQYYVQEMLAYRIYNLVTPHSFRVRPLDVVYQDARSGKADAPRFAFLIEDVDDVARRNGRKPSRRAEFAPSEFDSAALNRFMLFQYLIGNTDWEVLSGPKQDECCHNVRVTEGEPGAGLIAVPYDFDSAGMVDAKYAAPHKSLPIRKVTDRLFRGFCRHADSLGAARSEFLGHRRAVIALLDEAGLSGQRRTTAARYFAGFFRTLEDDSRFAREVSEKCRK